MIVSDLFNFTASDVKGKFTSPTAGSTEWNQWLSWANEELYSFGEVHDWPELTTRNYPIAISGTSGALPINFKKIAGYANVDGTLFEEVDGDLFDNYSSTSEVFRTGYKNGWYIETKKSGTTLSIPFVSYPTS